MLKASVCIQSSYIAISGSSIDAVTHQHSAIQLVYPAKKAKTELNSRPINAPVIIGSQVKHQLSMDDGIIMLIEPKSYLGRFLAQKLNGKPYLILSLELSNIDPNLTHIALGKNIDEQVQQLLSTVGFSQDMTLPLHSAIKDIRITKLLKQFGRLHSRKVR